MPALATVLIAGTLAVVSVFPSGPLPTAAPYVVDSASASLAPFIDASTLGLASLSSTGTLPAATPSFLGSPSSSFAPLSCVASLGLTGLFPAGTLPAATPSFPGTVQIAVSRGHRVPVSAGSASASAPANTPSSSSTLSTDVRSLGLVDKFSTGMPHATTPSSVRPSYTAVSPGHRIPGCPIFAEGHHVGVNCADAHDRRCYPWACHGGSVVARALDPAPAITAAPIAEPFMLDRWGKHRTGKSHNAKEDYTRPYPYSPLRGPGLSIKGCPIYIGPGHGPIVDCMVPANRRCYPRYCTKLGHNRPEDGFLTSVTISVTGSTSVSTLVSLPVPATVSTSGLPPAVTAGAFGLLPASLPTTMVTVAANVTRRDVAVHPVASSTVAPIIWLVNGPQPSKDPLDHVGCTDKKRGKWYVPDSARGHYYKFLSWWHRHSTDSMGTPDPWKPCKKPGE